MKILQVYKDYYPPVVGGVEKHIAQLCNYFRNKHEIEVMVCNHGPRTRIENIDGVRVTRVGQVGRLQSAPLSPAFPFLLRKAEADIFHYHMPNPTCEISHLLAKPDGRIVVTYLQSYVKIIRRESGHHYIRRTGTAGAA